MVSDIVLASEDQEVDERHFLHLFESPRLLINRRERLPKRSHRLDCFENVRLERPGFRDH
jgi:hypothetical protein